jgi:hypothetical protein
MKQELRNVHMSGWILLAICLPLLVALGALCVTDPMPGIFVEEHLATSWAVLDSRSCGSIEIRVRGSNQSVIAEAVIDDYPLIPAPYLYQATERSGSPDTVPLGPLSQVGKNRFQISRLSSEGFDLLVADAIRDTVICSIHFDL